MQQALKRQAWTCARCLRQQQKMQSRRAQSTGAAALVQQSPEYHAVELQESPSHSRDDTTLRNVFDSNPFWEHFSLHPSVRTKTRAGLIGNRYLTSPGGFRTFARETAAKCQDLVTKTLAASTVSDYAAIPKDLDRVSDLLCRVIDLSDFIRATHPDPKYVKAATEAYSLMFQYMNVYNTETGLNAQLKKAISMPEVASQWTREERAVAEILMKDFAKSGIDLPTKQREEFVSLSNDVSEAGTDFVNGMEFVNDHVALAKEQLAGVDPSLVRKLTWWDKAVVPISSPVGSIVMSTANDESARRAVYVADRTASKKTIGLLQKLLLKRAKLARLTGYSSFAQMTLTDKMAKTPEAVNHFLLTLNANNRGQVKEEIGRLVKANPPSTEMKPWNHGFYLQRLLQSQLSSPTRSSRSRLYEDLCTYLSLGTVIAGLSKLFQRLYGVRFVAKATPAGECWDPGVRRLDVLTDSQEHIGTVYCDLFARKGKPPRPAHFTLLCSREISDGEVEELQAAGEPLNDGMPTSVSVSQVNGKTTHNQIPTIALVCDFPEPSTGPDGEPALLSLPSLTTLFHEMGHAIHSILGRTSMQGIAGTRCATDFAELPSILMEYFAVDPGVLRMFARHWRTGAQIPEDMIEALRTQRQRRSQMTGGWENENQILMALLDQTYHSSGAVGSLESGSYDTTAVYHGVWNEHGSVPEPPGTAYQGFFGHLYGYGATYYSYLFDRAIARQVWRAVFAEGRDNMATDRRAGERLKNSVLRWGGGKDPWLCLEELMGEGRGVLAEGGEKAMLEVGKWGVGAGSEGAM
jgi:mitochondrial intermediate peptidase